MAKHVLVLCTDPVARRQAPPPPAGTAMHRPVVEPESETKFVSCVAPPSAQCTT